MSKLKDYDIMDIEAMDDERLEKSESGKIQVTRVYIKSEADKVIAEKDTKIIQLKALIENYNRISREIIYNANYQKYKRCLAMAKRCGIGAQFEHDKVIRFDDHFYIKRAELLEKWRNRWLELAKKFKPNSTAQ